jgi:hypothetical protein
MGLRKTENPMTTTLAQLDGRHGKLRGTCRTASCVHGGRSGEASSRQRKRISKKKYQTSYAAADVRMCRLRSWAHYHLWKQAQYSH